MIAKPLSDQTRRAYLLLYGLPLLLFILAAAVLYPFYQYRIVSDDISYLAIAERYLRGDYHNAINAYWSPLNIWLLAGLVKLTGMAILPASYLLNCMSFCGLLVLCIKLAIRYLTSYTECIGLGICLALFWATNIPVTHFADAMNSCLLMACLLLLLHRNFLERPLLWILFGFVSAIAYFSKAYSFYILPLTAALLVAMFLKQKGSFQIGRWLTILAVTTGSMVLFALPWILVIHGKYHFWGVSSAGGINTNWAIRGTMYFSDQFRVVVPPAYADGLSCWEDPYINKGTMLSPFGSVSLFAKQVFRAAMNVLQWFRVTAEFSPMYFPIWLFSLLYLLRKKVKDYNRNLAELMLAVLVFPAGYLMLSFGTRYLWFTVPLVMITGLVFFRSYLYDQLQPRYYKLLLLVYFASWLPGTVQELKLTLNEGKSDFAAAQQLRANHIKGSFIGNDYSNYQNHFRISWFSGNPFYMYFGNQWTKEELLAAAKKLNVNYYFYYYEGTNNDYTLTDEHGQPYPEVAPGQIDGIKVFRIDGVKDL